MTPFSPPYSELRELAKRCLAEDLPAGDPTGALVGDRHARANLVARATGTVAGLVAVQFVLDEARALLCTAPAEVELAVPDGARVEPGELLGSLAGPACTLLAAERSLLNVVTHLSGVATATAALVAAVAGTQAVVRDTRKTLPGLRAVEKYAVRCGGGTNHRMCLSDAILVKDNHLAALGGLRAAVEAALRAARASGLPVEVEVDSLPDLEEALAAGARQVLVDNMTPGEVGEAVKRAHEAGAVLEASGGITLANARLFAEQGVNFIAVGALTHSAPALDVGLDWEL